MSLNNILFIDIETVSQQETYHQLSEEWKNLWDHKASQREIKDPLMHTPESVYPRASIYAEFGKVICISCGYLLGDGEDRKLVLKSFYGDDEKELLSQFADSIRRWERNKTGQIDLTTKSLCAHNGKEFDFPYLCRRMVINGVALPEAFKISGRKPWDIKHLIDTLELWKFGDNKNYITLKLMAAIFNVSSPKDDIDGSMVYSVYWKDSNLLRIVEYCQKDVITLAQILLAFYCHPPVKPENISVKNEH